MFRNMLSHSILAPRPSADADVWLTMIFIGTRFCNLLWATAPARAMAASLRVASSSPTRRRVNSQGMPRGSQGASPLAARLVPLLLPARSSPPPALAAPHARLEGASLRGSSSQAGDEEHFPRARRRSLGRVIFSDSPPDSHRRPHDAPSPHREAHNRPLIASLPIYASPHPPQNQFL